MRGLGFGQVFIVTRVLRRLVLTRSEKFGGKEATTESTYVCRLQAREKKALTSKSRQAFEGDEAQPSGQ